MFPRGVTRSQRRCRPSVHSMQSVGRGAAPVSVLDAAGPARVSPPEKRWAQDSLLPSQTAGPLAVNRDCPPRRAPRARPPHHVGRGGTPPMARALPRGRQLSRVPVSAWGAISTQDTVLARRSRASARSAAGALPERHGGPRAPPAVGHASARRRTRRRAPVGTGARARAPCPLRRAGDLGIGPAAPFVCWKVRRRDGALPAALWQAHPPQHDWRPFWCWKKEGCQ